MNQQKRKFHSLYFVRETFRETFCTVFPVYRVFEKELPSFMYAFNGAIRDHNINECITTYKMTKKTFKILIRKFFSKNFYFNKFVCRKLYNSKIQTSILSVAFMLTIGYCKLSSEYVITVQRNKL